MAAFKFMYSSGYVLIIPLRIHIFSAARLSHGLFLARYRVSFYRPLLYYNNTIDYYRFKGALY